MSHSKEHNQSDNRICCDCVDEAYLKELIRSTGIQDFCFYCDYEKQTISMDDLANRIETGFEEHFERTPDEPDGWESAMLSDPDLEYDWEREGIPTVWAIASAAGVCEAIAEDIRSILHDRDFDIDRAKVGEECPFSLDAHYNEKPAGHGEFGELWNVFENELKTKTRFFSRSAKTILDRIFHDLSGLRAANGDPILVNVGPQTKIPILYRARVFAGEERELERALERPWKHLGTPPAEAAAAGRMNARGIAVFYGALDPETALKEVRPPVGSKVAVARFTILRPLRLLDMSAIKSVVAGGSIFDPTTLGRMQRANFLEILSWRMSRAVMPHEEASGYLPTQAVADYLAIEAGLDGLLFQSVQSGHQSSNVVLFHHASSVERCKLPDGTKVSARLDFEDSDGVHADYRVWEEVPPLRDTKRSQTSRRSAIDNAVSDFVEHFNFGPWTLSIDLEGIEVRHIQAVNYCSESHAVSRQRFEKENSILDTVSEGITLDQAGESDDPFN